MAFKEILTPILGPAADVPKDETTPEFMNMKFTELLENTKDNKQQISISSGQITSINNRTQISTYTILGQIGLTDAQFAGLTQVQAFDLLLTKLPRYNTLEIRIDSSLANFRNAIGVGTATGLFKIIVFAFERYVATWWGETNTRTIQCTGYPTYSSSWKSVLIPTSGTGSPEGVIVGAIGDMYINTSGGASTTLYVKTSGTGNTGWTAK